MDFELRKHNELKSIEAEKLKIEQQRLKMDQENMTMKQSYITAQTNLEKNKIVLLRMEIYEARQRIQKNNPSVTEAYLDHLFPYPN